MKIAAQSLKYVVLSWVFTMSLLAQVEFTAGVLTGKTTGETVVVPVTVKRFSTVTSVQFTLKWDPAVLEYQAVQDFGLNGLSSGSFGSSFKTTGRITASWDDPDGVGVSLTDGAKVFGVSFKVLGAAGTSSKVSFIDDPTGREVTVDFDQASFLFNEGSVSVGAVVPVNTAPVAVAQAMVTDEDTAKVITLAGTDAENNALNYTVVGQPTKGVLSGTGANLTYTPNANVNGSDLFTFKVNDGTVDSAVATVTINITAVNDAPVAVAQTVTTAEDTAKVIILAGTDAENNVLTYTMVGQPTKGALSGTAPNLTYTPNANANGSDSFTFKVNDGTVDSAVATVSISITAVNDAPVAVAQAVAVQGGVAKSIVLAGSDIEGSVLNYTVVGQPSKGSLSGTAPNLTYTPNANVSGSDSFTFKVNDGTVDSPVATVSLTIEAASNSTGVEIAAGSLVSVTPGSTVVVPVTVKRFASVTSIQFTLNWDATVLEYQAVQDFGLNGLSSGSFGSNLKTTGKLTASWDDPDGVGVSLTDGTKVFGVSFKVLGAAGTGSKVSFIDDPTGREVTVNFAQVVPTFSEGLVTVGASAPVNTAPVAVAQAVVTDEDTAKVITLAGTDAENNALTYTMVGQPTKGTLSGTAPNLTYTPNVNANGSDSFTFKVNDGKVDSTVATVSISITPVNDAPVAVAQAVTLDEDTLTNLELKASDVDGDSLTYTVVDQPKKGVLSGTGANRQYVPDRNYSGTDSFSFKVSDGQLESAVVVVPLKINEVNDAPMALAASVTGTEDQPLSIVLQGSDMELSPLTYTVVTAPTKGKLSGTGANLTYTPNANVNGSDSFTFKVNDGTVDSAVATVSISITAVNDAPVAVAQTINGTKNTARAVVLGGTDVESDALTFTVVTLPAHGTLSGSGKDRTYTPNSQYVGADSFTFKANDGAVDSEVVTVSITVQDKNDPPVAVAQAVTTDEDAPKAIILVGTDPDENPLNYTVVNPPTKGALSGTGANLTYTPDANVNGSDSFTFKVNDGTVDSAVATVTINITAVNDAPVAAAQSVTTDEDTAKAVLLAGTDVENDALNYTVVGQPTKGTLSGTAPNLTYTPNANANGSDSFTFKVNDGKVDSTVATVSISITPMNDAPVAVAQAVTLDEDTLTNLELKASDVDGDSLTYTVVDQPKKGVLSGTGANRQYVPDRNYSGTDSFSFKVSDGKLESAVVVVSLKINEVNDAPMALAALVTGTEDQPLSIVLQGSDMELSSLTYTVVTAPTKGKLSGTAPNLTYTPNANVNGSDSFTFKVNDGTVDSAVATVSINITAVNDAPVAVAQSVVLDEDQAKAIILSGTDVENDALAYVLVTEPAKGTLSGTPPNLTYTPKANLTGTDSFTFRVRDGSLDSSLATVSISITPINDAPVALAQSVAVIEDAAKSVTLKGSDQEGAALSYTVVSGPLKGQLSGTAPNLTYTPNANVDGSDSFTFKVNDGTLDSEAATVSVSIAPVNDAPVAVAQSVTTAEDTATAITLAGTDVENDALSYMVVSGPTKGSLSGSAPNLTYTPNADVNGSDSFTFKVNDGKVDSTVSTVSITITAVNDAPVAVSQSVSTPKNTTRSIQLGASDVENQALTYAVVSGPTHGTLSGSGASLVYTPESNFVGSDGFTFKASDGIAESSAVAVSIKVTASNVAPVALAQTVTTLEDTARALVLSGTDGDNDALTYSVVAQPTLGTLSGTPPNLTYVPEANATGTDSFTFKANDGAVDSAVATVTVTLTPVNDAPVAQAVQVLGDEDSTISVTLKATDVDGDSLTYAVVTPPSNGTLSGVSPLLSYTPKADFNGTDSFQFKVNDGTLDSAVTTVTLKVNPVNDPPVLDSLAKAVLESGVGLYFEATGSDVDLPAQTLSFSLKSGPAGMSVTKRGVVAWLPKASQRPSTNTVVLRLSDGIASVDRSFIVEAKAAKRKARFAGAAIDGYIAGATLWFDADLDGVLDPEEPHTITDREGNFDLDFDSTLFDKNDDGELDASEGRLVVEGGVDLSSGQPRVGQLTAPAGSEVITPLTTMVDLVSRQGGGLSTAEAEERVRSALGIPEGISVTAYDPVAAAVQGDTRAASVQVAASSIADTIGLLASVIDGASGSTDAKASSAVVSQVLASKLASGTAVDLRSTAALESTLTTAAATVGTSLTAEVTATVSQVVSEQNAAKVDAVANAWNPLDALKSISQVQAVSQSGTASALSDLGAGAVSTDEVNLLYTGSALTQAVAAAPVGDITGTDRRPGTFEITAATAVVTEGGRAIQPMVVARHDGAYGAVRLQVRLDGDADLLITNVLTLEFADAVTQHTVDLSSVLRDDADPQADRLLSVSLSLAADAPSGAFVGVQTQGTVRVVDNDSAGSIGFAASRFQVTEGGDVSVELRRLDGSAGKIVAVVRLYGGTATVGQDYPNAVITAEFLPGQTRKVVSLGWVDDAVVEGQESVNAVFEIGPGSASGSALVTGGTETVIEVDDNDLAAPNTAPVATGVAPGTNLTVVEGSSITLTLQGSDAEGSPLSFARVTAPTKGVLSGRSPNLVYTANLGARGTDSFTYKVNDGQLDSALATVTLVIKPINLAPEGYSQILSTDEDRSVGFRLTGSDPDGDALSFRVVVSPQKGRVSGTDPNFIYTPNPDATGLDSFQFRANDGKDDSANQTIWVVINPVNDAPVAQAQVIQGTEDQSMVLTLSGSDPEGSTLLYSVVQAPLNGVLIGTGARLTYQPRTNFNGTDRFAFMVNDGALTSTVATVTLSIAPVNDAPEAFSQSIRAVVATPTAVLLSGADPESDPLRFTVVKPPAQGTLTGVAPNLVYTATTGGHGTDSFTFRVHDGALDSREQTVSIELIPENLRPVALGQAVSVVEDTAKAITLAGVDPEKEPLTFMVVSGPTKGALSGAAPNLIYTPQANATGVDGFTFRVSDGSQESDTVAVTLNITAVNDAPVGESMAFESKDRAPVAIGLRATDVDSSVLKYSVVRAPAQGTLSGEAPNLVYTPRTNAFGMDTFTFVANDGILDSEAVEVTVRITGPVTIPVAWVQSVVTEEDVPLPVTLKATDEAGLPLTFTVDLRPASGTISGTGSNLVYTPKPGFNGKDTFGFRAFNGQRYSSSALVQIQVDPSRKSSVRLVAPAIGNGPLELDLRAGTGVKVAVEVSTDLNGWNEAVQATGQGNQTPVRVKVPVDASAKAQFWRVRRY